MHLTKTLVVSGLTLLCSSIVQAQIKTSSIEIGLNLGTLIYQGDLVPGGAGNLKTLKPAIGFYMSKTLDPYFAVRANFVAGKITSDEAAFDSPLYRQQRRFAFSSSVKELSGQLIFTPLGQLEKSNRFITPYLFAGAGLAFVKIYRNYSSMDTSVFNYKSAAVIGLGRDTLQKTPGIIAAFPLGGGVRFQLSPQLSLLAEATFRLTATDYADGFKYAANPANNDRYYGLSIGISYRFGGYKCPPAKR